MLSNDCPVQIVSIKIETQNIFTYFHLILNIVLLVILNPQFQSESRLKIKNLFYLQKIQMSLSLFCPQKSIIFLIMLSLASNINGQSFCSSACASRVDACYGISENECYACSASIFELNSNNGTCMPKNQHSVQFYELKNSAMDISTYSTNKPGVQSCSIYQMSGQYVSGDYIQKKFTGIPLNHYQLVIRFGVGHIGTWNPTDTMEIQIDGHTYSWQYNVCPEAQSLCSGSGADCFKIKQYVVTHDSPNVTLKFSSQITETNPLNQYWGIKDLVIGIRSCHARCATCFGANYADCSSCEAGYYLLGNLCVPSCQFLTIEDKRLCALQCPAGYFNNGNKLCKACQKDCLMCTGSGQGFCQVWNENKSGLIWEQNKPFWIFLIVVGFLIFLFLLWRMVLRKYFKPPIEDQGDMQKHMITENKIKDPKSSSSSEEKEKQRERERDRDKSKSSLKTSKILFEEQGLTWVQQLESAPSVAVSKQGQLKKRKKNRVKPLVIQEQTGSCSQPSLYEMEATNQNLKL